MTPAFTSSSLNAPISANSCSVGSTPFSLSWLALTIAMNRIAVSPSVSGGSGRSSRPARSGLHSCVDRTTPGSTSGARFSFLQLSGAGRREVRRPERDVEPVAPDDDAGPAGWVDLGRDDVVLV